MSVLVRLNGNYFVFAKGSPEIIHGFSTRKVKGFDGFLKKLSFSGYRAIGFGMKDVGGEEVEEVLKGEREDFLKQIAITGVVTFINELKTDAIETIATLSSAKINTKIITGDNIFLGVQTALSTGMIEK